MLVYHQQKENSLPVPESVADQTVSSSVPVNSDPQKQLLNMVTTAQNGCDSDSRITSSDGDKDTIINNQDDDNVVLLSAGNQGSSDDCSTLPRYKLLSYEVLLLYNLLTVNLHNCNYAVYF